MPIQTINRPWALIRWSRIHSAAIATALLLLCVIPAAAEVPDIHSVNPAFGYSDKTTSITIHGTSFGVGVEVGLWPAGGLVRLGGERTPGHCLAVDVEGTHAYVADRTGGAHVIDVSNPLRPTIVASMDIIGSLGVDVRDGLAYIVNGLGVRIMDVREPTQPVLLGGIDTSGKAENIDLVEDIAYVTDRHDGLKLIDVSEPTSPVLVGHVEIPSSIDVAVSGGFAYVAAYNSLTVVDVRDPFLPTIVGALETVHRVLDVVVVDAVAYITIDATWPTFEGSLWLVDISVPALPTLIASIATPDASTGLDVSGGFAFVAKKTGGLRVIDIHHATEPSLVGEINSVGTSHNVTVVDGTAYLADQGALQIFDVHNPADPGRVGLIGTSDYANDVVVAGEHAYVADDRGGVRIIDVLDPSVPVIVGSSDQPDYSSAIAYAAGIVYVVNWVGLQLIEVHDPTTPRLAGFIQTPGEAFDVSVHGTFAFVADGEAGVLVIEVSDPHSPALVGSVDTPGFAVQIVADDDYVYVADVDGGLQVVDARDPSRPALVGAFESPYMVTTVTVSDGVAYVGDGAGLHLVDVADPTQPSLISSVAAVRPDGLDVADGYVYVADRLGLKVIDATVPEYPILIGAIDTLGFANSVAASDGLAYIADGQYGLRILHAIQPPLEAVQRASSGEIDATVPSSLQIGPYDVWAAQTYGEAGRLAEGFRVCERLPFGLAMEAQLHFLPAGLSNLFPCESFVRDSGGRERVRRQRATRRPTGVRHRGPLWRISVIGDRLYSVPQPSHEAALVLPALPPELSVLFLPSREPRQIAIELRIAGTLDHGVVTLVGPEEDAARSRWNEILASGLISLPAIDNQSYGDIALTVRRPDSLGRSLVGLARDGFDRAMSMDDSLYRYEFADGVLVGAHASGPGADHIFRATGVHSWSCEEAATMSFLARRRELCELPEPARP